MSNNEKLIRSSKEGNIKSVVKLINKLRKAEDIADIYYTDPSTGYAALHTAVKFNQYEATRIILENGGIDVNWPSQGKDRQTPLHIACQEQHPLLVKLLV